MSDLRAAAGALYGTTVYGGITNANCALGCGTLFSIDTSGRERVLHRFTGGSDGAAPLAGVVIDGALYGTTSAGGGATGCGDGCGTVYKAGTGGTPETVLHAFKGGTDGADPVARMVRFGSVFYGTTQYGGQDTPLCPSGCGTVFSMRPDGAERVIYRFKGGKDGANPSAPLYVYGGRLYGTTQYGGATTPYCSTGCGTIFQISVTGVKKTLHAFHYSPASTDGAFPASGLIALRSKLYGTSFGGGKHAQGTVFAIDPSTGSELVVHSFLCCHTVTDGEYPLAGLIVRNGILFGTTREGGVSGRGTVFEVRVPGGETVLHDFAGKPDGATPSAGLAVFGSQLYGTAADGGARSEGAVFALTP